MLDEVILREVAAKYGTPVFIFDADELVSRIKAIREILDSKTGTDKKIGLCYSIKANPFLIPYLDKYVDMFEVCSPGELEIIKKYGILPDKIIYSGVNKGLADISEAVDYGAAVLTAESIRHFELIEKAAANMGTCVHVILRLTSGNQFGMSVDDIKNILSKECSENIVIEGIHYFAGTQRNGKNAQEKDLEKLKEIIENLRTECGNKLPVLEYGPGLSYPYFAKDDFSDTLMPLKNVADALADASDYWNVTIEMGRFIASSCGYYLSGICDIKESNGQKWCIIDGGLNHVNYYGQMMGMKIPVIRHLSIGDLQKDDSQKEPQNYMICGSLCTANDILVRELPLSGAQMGDVLVFENLGAYSITEGINLFLSRDMAKVVAYKDGKLKLLRDTLNSWKLNCIQ